MGVDNRGILFMGLKEEELDLAKLGNFDFKLMEDEGLWEALWSWDREHGKIGLTCQENNGYSYDFRLVGYQLAASQSYGCDEVEDLAGKIGRKNAEFYGLFGVLPKIYIMNYQS